MSDHTIEFLEILDQKLPDVQTEVDWQGGVSGLPSLTRALLIVAASAGYNGQVKRITSVSQGISLYGEGSPMACAIQAALSESSKVPLYAVSVAAGVGTATLTGTFAGTATASGVIKAWVAGRLFQVPVTNGDAAAAVRTSAVAAFTAAAYNCPADISAGVAAGAIDIDAVTAGKVGNTIRVRIDCTNVPGITVDVGGGALAVAEAPLSGGTTDTDPESTLGLIEADRRFHVIALGCEDTTAIGKLNDHAETVSGPSIQKWGMGVVATVDGSATAQSIADSENSKRLQIFSLEDSPRPTFEMAAALGAIRAAHDPREELDDVVSKWLLPPFVPTVWPAPADLEADLGEGVSPLYCVRQGNEVRIARSIHTEHGGGVDIQKAWDTSIVEKADYYRESLLVEFAKYKGKTLKSVSPAGRPNTMTPEKAVAVCVITAKRLDTLDFLDGVEEDKAAGRFDAQVNAINPDRLDIQVPFRPSRSAHLIAMQLTYTY